MSSIASVGLVWGLPVRPDLLGQALQAYQSALPTLTALRLCHRLGKGPNVHVTKLPPEILLAIEDMIFDRKLEYYPWLDAFKHYESRCEPVEHLEDGYCDIFAEVKDEINDEMCSMCKGESLWCPDECTEDCAFKVEMKMNEGMCENGSWTYDCCEPECDRWEELIAQGEGGNFTSYDEILRKNFGLEAYFATCQVTDETKATWPEDFNHLWRPEKKLQTTICYLTLPKAMPRAEYETSEMEDEMGIIDIRGSESYLVTLPTLEDKEARAERFKRALSALKLKPYVHPSQLNKKVSATGSAKEQSETKSVEGDEKAAEYKAKVIAQIEWPQLIMLSKTSFAEG